MELFVYMDLVFFVICARAGLFCSGDYGKWCAYGFSQPFPLLDCNFLLKLLTRFLSPVASHDFLADYQSSLVCLLMQIQFSGSCSSFRIVVACGYHIRVHWYALHSSIWLSVKHHLMWGFCCQYCYYCFLISQLQHIICLAINVILSMFCVLFVLQWIIHKSLLLSTQYHAISCSESISKCGCREGHE